MKAAWFRQWPRQCWLLQSIDADIPGPFISLANYGSFLMCCLFRPARRTEHQDKQGLLSRTVHPMGVSWLIRAKVGGNSFDAIFTH